MAKRSGTPTTTARAEVRREALTWLARRLAWERTLADLRTGRVRSRAA
jgi:hypothetical protein